MPPVIARVRPGECHVWSADATALVPALLPLLDARERERYENFLRPEPQRLYLTAHALVRHVVAAQLDADPRDLAFVPYCKHCSDHAHGKPALPGTPLEFSLSHSGDRVLVAVTLGVPVGVDVEQTATFPDLPLMALSEPERKVLDALDEQARRRAFSTYWSRKEAVLKATGDGLMVDPSRLTVSAPDAPAELLEWQGRPEPVTPVRLYDVPAGDGYRAAVALLGDDHPVVVHEVAYDGDGVLHRPRR
ncbi:4'-phosphopantetheinyl transferase superfamily protein [Streptomyces sp. NPDC001941]|uniref:4'-phosphopantetheinyl transferase family protein n=1 Tax=Streptomyces sp. NPDC001941 TaxID=3154659 RepID=UPI003322D7F1